MSAGVTAWLVVAHAAAQSDGFQILQPTPGGVDPHPYITSITETQGLQLHWFGFQGPYQVQRTTNLNVAPWLDLGAPTSGNSATITKQPGNNFHRIKGGVPSYQGIGVCSECHSSSVSEWEKTSHAKAFDTLKNIGQHNNPECVVCHTVGARVSSGFVSETVTPHLTSVQCENCHGPAGNHVGSGDPPSLFPIKTRSAMLCGGCHNGFHHPTYDEWTSSPHSAVVESIAEEFLSTNRTTAVGRMNSCGSCHSGAVRLAMLSAYSSNNRTNVNWPSGHDAAETPTTCVVCHETHRTRIYTNVLTRAVYTNQLRYPLTSTNVLSYNTSLPFASNYNASVNVCGQCHNARGAVVSSSGRPPHYSPQYNIFLGVIGVTTNGAIPQGAHKGNSRQCAGCHTHRHNEDNPTEQDPTFTGHAFRVTTEACAVCHTETTGPFSPTNLLFTTQSEISGLISTTKNLLDLWATTKNTNSWQAKYEARGWEYTSPGKLSNPSGSSTIVGPNSTEQADIPQGIKDARFNLYLVSHDKSLGIHNAPYTRYLLGVAQQRVNAELAK